VAGNTGRPPRQPALVGCDGRFCQDLALGGKGLAPNKLVVWCYNQLDSFRSNDGGELWSPSHPITEPSISVVVPIANKVGEATLLRSIELSIN